MLSSYIKRKYERGQKIIETRPDGQDYLDILEQYRLQFNWIKRVYMDLDESNPERVAFSPPPFEQRRVEVQGPFDVHPEPLIISEHSYEASDILMLGTEPFNVLAIAFNNGRVDICIEAEKIEAMWNTQAIVSDIY
jgi:hypothetical protein